VEGCPSCIAVVTTGPATATANPQLLRPGLRSEIVAIPAGMFLEKEWGQPNDSRCASKGEGQSSQAERLSLRPAVHFVSGVGEHREHTAVRTPGTSRSAETGYTVGVSNSSRSARWNQTRAPHSVSEAYTILGVGRNAGYEAVRTGCIRAIKIGKRVVIPKAEIERLLSGEPAQAAGSAVSPDKPLIESLQCVATFCGRRQDCKTGGARRATRDGWSAKNYLQRIQASAITQARTCPPQFADRLHSQ
jgi:excisionase family DNA binding protein